MAIPIFSIPAAADLDTSSDRHLHESLKSWEGYADLGLPKSIFWKLKKITSKDFTERNPCIAKVRYRGKIHYGYQRANAAREDGLQLQQKKFNLPTDLCDRLAARAKEQGITQTQYLEDCLRFFLYGFGQ